MAAKSIHRTALWASCFAFGLGVVSAADAQNFTMRLDYAVVYTPFEPNGHVDTTSPYTLCRNNAIGLRFRYTWLNNFQEYVYTEPASTLFPNYFMQGVTPNPVNVPPAQPGNPVIRNVSVGLIAGSVDTGGVRQVAFRGRTSGFFGSPVQSAIANVLIETQIEPQPTLYREIADGSLDMPTQPWFVWAPSILNDDNRLDIGECTNANARTPEDCEGSAMPIAPLTETCDTSDYCWIGQETEHQVPANSLDPDTPYQYHVLGRNICGVSNELGSDPPRPFFRTAQACFVVPNGNIPDGGSVSFDATTLTQNANSLAAGLRVTVHADHADVSDLRISLTKTSPVVAGPLLLMDRPSGANCINGVRIQAAFADGAMPPAGGCNGAEPAISGRVSPVQALSSFAPLEGAGTWRLTVEDTNLDGKSGSLLEWCLSTDPQLPPLQASPFVSPTIFANAFE